MTESVHSILSNNRLIAAALYDTVDALVVVTDAEGRIIVFNTACQLLMGKTFNDVAAKPVWNICFTEDDQSSVREAYRQIQSTAQSFKLNSRCVSRSGEHRQIDWSMRVYTDPKNMSSFVVAMGIDITAQAAALSEATLRLEEVANRDGLTGLFNRRYFETTLQNEIRRTMRHSGVISLLFCDIDFFRDYNENYSHVEADTCLKEIAELIKQRFQRAGDVVARSGGDEFGVILPDTNSDEAYELAQSLRSLVWERHMPHNASPVANRITLSIGVATYHADYQCDAESIIKLANKALYLAKFDGRNRIALLQLP